MAVHEIRIDRSKTLVEEPATGHNRWHPDIAPVVRCEPGDEVVLETRDAFDGQMGPQATLDTVAAPNLDVVHPLTGPVYVEGAEPGDLLEVEIVEVVPDSYGYTVQVPGFGFLRDVFPDPFMVRWDDRRRLGDLGGPARRTDPRRAVHGHDRAVAGAGSAAPDHRARARRRWTAAGSSCRRRRVRRAVRSGDRREALRTIPPREQAGNVDIKQLAAGTRLFIPVDTPGALFSAGDAHFAQGDCETCGTAIEMNATLRVRFAVHSGAARDKGIRDPRFARTDYWVAPEYATPRRFYATTGMSVDRDGELHAEDVTLAARNALLNMIDHLGERGWNRQQAYAICSVAVDLKVSQLVDVPSFLVSAFLPEDIFTT